ncbi:MAG: DUF4062 domain-containing protein, partial [Candidatus Promineifilaceae bacterium]|nr:DUF4062 domain-containing protein [Candidatus Promineifilaceae bacterium]
MADQRAGQTVSGVIRTPDQRLRVFVSSTLQELAPEREAVKQAVSALRLYPVMFELGARPHAPRDLYRAYLAQSHIFIGIYWQRYGWVAPDMAISGLEDEYRLVGDLPKLIYIKAPAPEREPRLAGLLQEIKRDSDVSYKYFATPEELGELVGNDLALLLTERFELAQLRSDAPATAAEIITLPHSPVPQPVAPVFGRQNEVQAVRTMLQQERVRLLTLLGPGGVGKTSLALQVAARVADDFADGVCWVPLAPISSPDLVTSAIAKALDVRERGGHSLQESLVHYLRQRQLLLLLDNFEHLLETGPLLMELLATAPEVKILVTSRAGLELRGEYEFPVPPLPLPAPAEVAPRPAQLMKNAAVRLFVERAQAAMPDFELTLDNSVAVREIVRRLEGLPLAIELAAARVKLLPPDAILARLSSRLQLLTGGARDLPARQQTMRSTLDWSYQLLEEPTRTLLARLGIFAGSFTLSAAEAVADTAGELDVFEGIAALVSNSLLRQSLDDAPSQWSEPRFSMLETVREYALERLAAAGEVEALKERHGAYFARLAAEAEPHYFSGQSEAWLDRMAADYSNFRAALHWLQSRPETHRASWHLIRDLLWLWY